MSAYEELKRMRENSKKLQEEAMNSESNSYSEDYEVVEAVGIPEDRQIAVRIVSNPFEVRRSPYDCKFVLRSRLLRDNGKNYSDINWQWIITEKKRKVNTPKGVRYVPHTVYAINPDWILGRVYTETLSGSWNNDTVGKSVFTPKWGDTEIYKRLTDDSLNTVSGSSFKVKVAPSGKVAMNVIDRMDDWCIENKHTKILAQNVKILEDHEKGRAVFINNMLSAKKEPDNERYSGTYDSIRDHFLNYVGDWMNTDCILQRKGMNTIVYDAGDSKFIKGQAAMFASNEPLNEEEKKYEKYNLDELYFLKTTSSSYLLKHHRKLFELFDEEIGNKIGWSSIEELEKDSKHFVSDEGVSSEEEKKDNEVVVEIKKEVVVEGKKEVKDFSFKQVFPYFDKLKEEEKSLLNSSFQGFNEDKTEVLYSDKSGRLLPCVDNNCSFNNTNVKTLIPGAISSYCPVCGKGL